MEKEYCTAPCRLEQKVFVTGIFFSNSRSRYLTGFSGGKQSSIRYLFEIFHCGGKLNTTNFTTRLFCF